MKFKPGFLIVFCLLIQSGHAQVDLGIKKLNADSLVALIHEKKSAELVDAELVDAELVDAELVEVLNALSNVLCLKNSDSSMLLAEEALQLAEKLEDDKGLADGHFNRGIGYFILHDLRRAMQSYLKAMRIYEDLPPSKESANLYIQLTIINFIYNRPEKIVEYSRRALSLYEKLNDRDGIVTANMGLGMGFIALNELDSAYFYNKEALRNIGDPPDQNKLANIYNDFGRINGVWFVDYGDTAYLHKAISWFLKGLELPDINKKMKGILTFNAGAYYNDLGTEEDIARGMEYLNQLRPPIEKEQDNAFYFTNLAWLKYDQGDYDSAIILFHKILELVENNKDSLPGYKDRDPISIYYGQFDAGNSKKSIHEGLSETYEALGEDKKALMHYKLSNEAGEEILLKKNQDMIALLETESEDEKINNKMDLMARDIQYKDIKLNQSRLLILGLAGLFFILMLLGILFFRQNRLKNKHNTVVLEQKLLRSQMNPHFIFNALANIQEFIWNKDPLVANEYLSSFSKLVRLILENSRNDFVPLEKEVSAIQHYLTLQKLRFQKKFEYTIDVDPEIDLENMSIPPLLVQPYIENSIEHGIRDKETTGHIEVNFRLKGDLIHVEVKDDGIGFKRSSEIQKNRKKDHQSLAMTITQERLFMLYKKYRRRIQLSVSDIKDEQDVVIGAKVEFGIPFIQI